MANIDPVINLDTYSVKENEVLVYCPVYNTSTGMYRGITKKLGLITLRGGASERFFSYGYNKEKSSLLYCSVKSPLPNIFSCTSFKKHTKFLMDQNESKVRSSDMFMFLPATLDRKEDFLKWKDNVHLHPIDLTIDDLIQITNLPKINPLLLDIKESRDSIMQKYYKIMQKVAEISNQNPIRNSDAYISS